MTAAMTSSWWAWYGLLFLVQVFTPQRKKQKGYVWRAIRATVFRRFWSRKPPDQLTRRWILVWSVVGFPISWWLDPPIIWPILYGLFIIIELDDYLNGDDDDRQRRWDAVKNKIRWLMDLPPKPAEGQVSS